MTALIWQSKKSHGVNPVPALRHRAMWVAVNYRRFSGGLEEKN